MKLIAHALFLLAPSHYVPLALIDAWNQITIMLKFSWWRGETMPLVQAGRC